MKWAQSHSYGPLGVSTRLTPCTLGGRNLPWWCTWASMWNIQCAENLWGWGRRLKDLSSCFLPLRSKNSMRLSPQRFPAPSLLCLQETRTHSRAAQRLSRHIKQHIEQFSEVESDLTRCHFSTRQCALETPVEKFAVYRPASRVSLCVLPVGNRGKVQAPVARMGWRYSVYFVYNLPL